MNEHDDFFIAFEKQVKEDIEEFLGISSEHFSMSLWVTSLRRGAKTWKQLPSVHWEYKVVDSTDGVVLVDQSGWMMTYGGNWGDLHNRIMEDLGSLLDFQAEEGKRHSMQEAKLARAIHLTRLDGETPFRVSQKESHGVHDSF